MPSQGFGVPLCALGHKAAPELSRCANPASYDLPECPQLSGICLRNWELVRKLFLQGQKRGHDYNIIININQELSEYD
jgi:hypothetical protein